MNVSHRTAMARKAPSSLARTAMDLRPDLLFDSILDWGCGRGYDVAYFNGEGVYSQGYDPHYAPEYPRGIFDLVTCTYVLNVCKDYRDRIKCLKEAKKNLKRRGHILVCARSDKEINYLAGKGSWTQHGDGFLTKSGTFQCGLSLEGLISIMTDAGFKIVSPCRLADITYRDVVWALGRKK
jgi:DNA phosphorothioation-associated putative methyltransferase